MDEAPHRGFFLQIQARYLPRARFEEAGLDRAGAVVERKIELAQLLGNSERERIGFRKNNPEPGAVGTLEIIERLEHDGPRTLACTRNIRPRR